MRIIERVKILPEKKEKLCFKKALEEKPSFLLMAGLGLVMLICLINYCYVDLQMIVRHSLNIWDCLFTGHIFDFYQTGSELLIGRSNPRAGEVPYDIWVYIPLAIWNLPIYLWEKITGLTFETNFFALLWARVGNLIPFAGSLWAISKLLDELKVKPIYRIWGGYLYASSMLLLNGLFLLGQIDILNTFFMLMGLTAYIRKDRKKFLVWFALSTTCKMFSLFCFLPLIVLREKKILYMIRDTLLAMSLSLLSKILFFADKMNTPTQFDEFRFSEMLFVRKLQFSETSILLFLLLFAGLLIWCWCKEYEEDEFPYLSIIVAFAGYSCFFIGAKTYPYWAVVLSPFIPLFVVLCPKRGKILLWLDTAAGAAYFGFALCKYGWVYSARDNTRWMLAGILNNRQVRGLDLHEKFSSLWSVYQENILAFLTTIFVISIVSVLVIVKTNDRIGREVALDKGSIWMRFLINSFLAMIPLILYLAF